MDFSFFYNNLLSVVAVLITLVLVFHYLMEKDKGVSLSKRYRNSIFEVQSKIFLNATQYLISGNRDLAIKEFLNAVDINKNTVDTYFALGGLFRSNGEIERAIGIHRSIIARENISESTRLRALTELAIDFDRGGFIDKAIETYKDVLKINRDQIEVVESVCRIYEDIGDWDNAYSYRLMLSKLSHVDQSETISHVLVEKAKKMFVEGDYQSCRDLIQEAFKFAPSISAKLMELKVVLIQGEIERSKFLLQEILHEHNSFVSFLFIALKDSSLIKESDRQRYKENLSKLLDHFVTIQDAELNALPQIILAKAKIMSEKGEYQYSFELVDSLIKSSKNPSEYVMSEYLQLLIKLKKYDEIATYTSKFLDNHFTATSKHYCKTCGYNSDEIFWRCPQCYNWETIQFRWKV